MGKNQHSKDRMYVTATEWSQLYGGKRKASHADAGFKRLPFDACALSFAPFETPMATRDGVVFDLLNIVPYVKKYGVNPVNGQRLKLKDLVKLNYHKNADGKYHDPVTYKIFSESSHIVAVIPSGNVYHNETIQQFNAKANNWRDLLTEQPFTRADMITLQDPKDLDKHNYTKFYHMLQHEEDAFNAAAAAKPKATSEVKGAARQTSAIMKELRTTETEWKKDLGLHSSWDSAPTSDPKDQAHTAHYSTGEAAASFTSTHLSVKTKNTAAALDDETVRYSNIKKKGYVALKTNVGTLNLELHCDIAPRTCENFIRHCNSGYYKNTVFHRSIKHFMVQGGDPTGTGKGGESAFPGGKPFADEFKSQLSHKSRGILSMANSGPNTNKSQFFITYRPCTYLDKKHTVFGHVVGGMDTLANLEGIETDGDDRPKRTVKVVDVTVFQDPYQEVEDEKAQAAAKAAAAEDESASLEPNIPAVKHAGVGKYIGSLAKEAKRTAAASAASAAAAAPPVIRETKEMQAAKKVKRRGGFGDFSAW